jgi:RHS repeat-associated protein
MYVFPTRKMSPCQAGTGGCLFGGNAIAGTAGTWGQETQGMAGLADVNGDGAQDHWLGLVVGTARNANVAFNYGDEIHVIPGSPPTGQLTTPAGTIDDWIKPGNDTHICAPHDAQPGLCDYINPFSNILDGRTSAAVRVVDVDNDGRIDVMTSSTETATPKMHFNAGGQFIAPGIDYPATISGVATSVEGFRRTTHAVKFCSPLPNCMPNTDSGLHWRLKSDLIDLDGDGIAEGVYFDDTLGFRRALPQYLQPPRLLRAVHNGRGEHSTITYAQMHDATVVTQSPSALWPDGRPKASPRAQWVVKSLQVHDDLALTDGTTQYAYKNPRYGADNEGHYSFRGFEEVTTTKPGPTGAADGGRTIQRYGFDVDWSGRLVTTVVMPSVAEAANDARVIDKTSWQLLTLFAGALSTYHPLVSEHYICSNGQTEAACIATPAGYSRTTSTWTAYPTTAGMEQLWAQSGSLLQTGTTAADGDRQTLTTYYLKTAGSQYFLRPEDTTRQNRASGAMVTVAKSRRTWDANNGAQVTDEVWIDSNDANRAITRYDFDSSTGNRTKVWKPVQWAANPDPLTNLNRTTYSFDGRKLFVANEVNEVGHARDYTWEYGTGTKLETLGPNLPQCAVPVPNTCPQGAPLKEDHKIRVDGMGRLIERYEAFGEDGSVYSLLKVETNTYVDSSASSVTHQAGVERLVNSDNIRYSQDKTDLDGHGRPIRKTNYVLGDAPADQVTTFQYANDGTLTQVLLPDPTANDTTTVSYTYTFDSLGRPKSVRRPDATAAADKSGVDIAYDGLTQTTTEILGIAGGQASVTKATDDIFGRLARVDDLRVSPSTYSTTTYSYDANDNVKQVVDAEGVTTTLAHDFAGRRTQITRNTRIWSYGYDKNGNMISQTTPCTGTNCAASYTATTAYDNLDRPISKLLAPRNLSAGDLALFGAGSETFTWDGGNNGKGRLSQWNTFAPGSQTPTLRSSPSYNAQGQQGLLNETMNAAGYSGLSRSFFRRWDVSGAPREAWFYDIMGTQNCVNGSLAYTQYDKRGLPFSVQLQTCVYDPSTPISYMINTRNVAGLVTRRYSQPLVGTITNAESDWTYDKVSHPTSQIVKKGVALDQVARQDLLYFGNDNLKQLDHWLGVTNHKRFAYGYDVRHQLTTVSESLQPNAFTATYGYGNAGRFASANESAASLPNSDVKIRNVTYQYSSTDPERLITLKKTNNQTYASYTYDDGGNQLTRTYSGNPTLLWEYVYDGKNQLRRATKKSNNVVQGSEEYWYDQSGKRTLLVKRDAVGNKTELIWFIEDTEAHYDATGNVTKVYGYATMGTPVFRVERTTDAASTVEYQFHGLASSTLATVDQVSGTINASFDYAPFGEIIEATDGGGSSAGIAKHRRRMNDKYVDELSDLAYYGFRYYDKTSMTWTQSDPLYRFAPDAAWSDPRRANLYSFDHNNPLRYLDPDGRSDDVMTWGAAAAGLGEVLKDAGPALIAAAPEAAAVVVAAVVVTGLAYAASHGGVGGAQSLQEIDNPQLTQDRQATEREIRAPGETSKAVSEATKNAGSTEQPGIKSSSTAMESRRLGTAGGERAGKPFTQAGKKVVKQDNKASNGGKMKCENCGKKVKDAKQSKSGQTPPSDEAHVDHVVPAAEDGDGSPPNGQVLCRDCNLEKSDKI